MGMPANKETAAAAADAKPNVASGTNPPQRITYRLAGAAAWLTALLVSIGFSVHFGLELVRFGRGEQTNPPFTGELKIALLDWVGFYPMVVASRKGFTDRRLQNTGAHVEMVNAPVGIGEMNDLIRTGKVHAIFGVLADFVVLKSLATPIRLVMVTDFSKSDVIVAKKEIRTPNDLRGKRIGISELSSYAEYAIIRFLEKAAVDRRSISFQTVPPMQVPEAIEAGRIEAGYTWEPALSRAKSMGMNVVISSAESPELVISSLAFRQEVLVTPQIAAAVVLSYYDGLAYFSENPDDFCNIVANYFGIRAKDVLRFMKEDALFMDLNRNLELFAEDGTVQKEMRSINQFFSERGIRQSNESISRLVDLTPLMEANRIGQAVEQ